MSYEDLERALARQGAVNLTLREEITRMEAGHRLMAAEIERLRALLVRYQVANYIPEDCDLYKETSAVLEQFAANKKTAEPL